jgi:uncharacterized DUF497 family protein
MKFDWDDEKAESNFNKHGISFNEAMTVFGDYSAKLFYDKEHSKNEIREIIICYSELNRLLTVYFTERENKLVRIITARKATKLERKGYEENERR